MPSNRGNRYDWDTLFLEWMMTDETVTGFFQHREMEVNHAVSVAKKKKWREKRAEVERRALNRALKKVEKEKTLDYVKHIKANDMLLAFVYTELRKGQKVDDEGNMIGLGADTISKLTSAVERIVKTHSFMNGGPTERTESKTANIHADITDLIEKQRNGEL